MESTYCEICKKDLYETEEDAERMAEFIWEDRGVALRVYACPHGGHYGSGWHLTKRGADPRDWMSGMYPYQR